MPLVDEKDDPSQLWWGAVQSDALIGNGLPGIPFGPSTSRRRKKDPSAKHPTRSSKRHQQPEPPNPKSLLSLMNHNIKTMRRVRHTHAKFAALNAASAPQEDDDPGGEGGSYSGQASARVPGTSALPNFGSFGVGDDEIVDDRIDEAPWAPVKRKGKRKTSSRLSGIDIGEENASDCLHWSTNKILEHEGFQGALLFLFPYCSFGLEQRCG